MAEVLFGMASSLPSFAFRFEIDIAVSVARVVKLWRS